MQLGMRGECQGQAMSLLGGANLEFLGQLNQIDTRIAQMCGSLLTAG